MQKISTLFTLFFALTPPLIGVADAFDDAVDVFKNRDWKIARTRRTGLQLYYIEELNVREVAAILGVKTGRVLQIKRATIERAHTLIMEHMEP